MKLSKQELLLSIIELFLLLGLVPPAYLNQNLSINRILDLLRFASFFSIFLFYLIDFEIHTKKPFNWVMVSLFVELLLATIISKRASLHSYITMLIPSLGLIIFAEELTIRHPYVGIKTLYFYFAVCTFINTITVFLFPGAMYANNRGLRVCWFLGEDNGGYAYYIMACICAMLYCHYAAKSLTVLSILIWTNSFVFVFYRDIVTGIICQSAFLLLFIISHHRWFQKILKASYTFHITFLGLIFLVFTRKWLIESIATAFSRKATLGRTELWDCVLKRIMERPIFGFGICSGEEFNKLALNNGLLNAHNWTLMLAFYGGVIAIILFFGLIFSACYQAKDFCSTQYYQYVSLGLVVYSVRLLVEAGNSQFLFMLLAMLVYSKEFLENINEEDCLGANPLLEFTGIPQIKLSFRRSMK